MQVDRLLQLAGGVVQVAHQEGRTTTQRRGEGNGPEHPGSFGGVPQLARQLDHVPVRSGAVEQVLSHTEVRVEDPRRHAGSFHASAHLQLESLEPLAPGVSDQTLQGDQVNSCHSWAPSDTRRRASAAASAAASRSPW